jgi:hypothetical protein
MSNIEEIKRKYQEFQTACKTTLPKVDSLLIEDLVIRQLQNPEKQSMYTIEVFSNGSRSTDDVRNDILAATGSAPSIHDNGTHYVINSKVTLETLETIQKYPDVIEIKGEYTGGASSRGATHDRGERDNE